MIALAKTSEPNPSPLAAARLRRKLTVEQAAGRAGIPVERVEWIEEGRVYRFATQEEALLTALVYGSALGIGRREARKLAGLPLGPLERSRRGRLAVAVAVVAAAAALAGFVALPSRGGEAEQEAALARAAATLPPAWEISVDVLNGNGDINWTRQLASRIGAMAYQIDRVSRADRFDYAETAVYYERGGRAVAERLARQLGVAAKPLPGGTNPRRLVVVVGPQRGLD